MISLGGVIWLRCPGSVDRSDRKSYARESSLRGAIYPVQGIPLHTTHPVTRVTHEAHAGGEIHDALQSDPDGFDGCTTPTLTDWSMFGCPRDRDTGRDLRQLKPSKLGSVNHRLSSSMQVEHLIESRDDSFWNRVISGTCTTLILRRFRCRRCRSRCRSHPLGCHFKERPLRPCRSRCRASAKSMRGRPQYLLPFLPPAGPRTAYRSRLRRFQRQLVGGSCRLQFSISQSRRRRLPCWFSNRFAGEVSGVGTIWFSSVQEPTVVETKIVKPTQEPSARSMRLVQMSRCRRLNTLSTSHVRSQG